MSYTEKEKQKLADYPVGTVVKVKDPDGYIASVASKLRDRLGEVTGHTQPSSNPVVCFHAIGRRQEFRQAYSFGSVSELEVVTDAETIAQWRAAVKETKEKAAAKAEKTKKLASKKPA